MDAHLFTEEDEIWNDYRIVIHELARTLKMVEWTSTPGGETICPWCLNLKIEGHKNKCPRKVALSNAGEY